MRVVHAISATRFGHDTRTRCGQVACVMNADTKLTYYSLVNVNGNPIYGAVRETAITCKKCIKPKGTRYDPHRPAKPQKRAVEAPDAAAGRTARARRRLA